MTHYIGIDLGTTNSAIASYDGEAAVKLYKSPEQYDVTPSVIFFDRRGNKYVGSRAYNNAARNPGNAAMLFKRLMGTSTPIHLQAVNLTLTPEECSAEVLRAVYGYLPDDVRNSEDTGTVITVPAAFNQMQKDATMAAAQNAGLGRVALMQEPVAAVMSVMQQRKTDGVFLIYDLGGGTLDIAIGQSTSGRVSLLAHGGIEMCGGRDFDRMILETIVKPWLISQFQLPADFVADPQYKALLRMAAWASERAKIELSARETSTIALSEAEIGAKDPRGNDIYLDVPISRKDFDALISTKIEESIASARETMQRAGLEPHDIERMVFVGGPTQYKPLRDRVAFELGIAASTDVNPMTAVAEGAAIFAESIDWASQSRGRKAGRGAIAANSHLDISFGYTARTPDSKARIAVKLGGKALSGAEFQVDSMDTGWSSGRLELKDGISLEVFLPKPGDNHFKIFVFDAAGGPVSLANDQIVITRTAAQVDAIPASHSIGVEARERIGGRLVLDYLVRVGDQLPKKARKTFKAEESLRAGGAGSIRFKLWEGEIEEPITDNRFIGMFEINGRDFEDGAIAKGADLVCDYEISDSGNVTLDITVPSIGGAFHSGKNYYSRQEGQIDYSSASKRILEESEQANERLNDIATKVADPSLHLARERLKRASSLEPGASDPETAKQAMDDVQEAKRLIAQARKANLRPIRQLELDKVVAAFNAHVRQLARPAEETSFDNLAKTAQRAIDNNSGDFESHLDEMRQKNFMILWRQDWFIIDRFKWLSGSPHFFPNAGEHAELVSLGQQALNENDMDKLRKVVVQLDLTRIGSSSEDDLLVSGNIITG